MYAFHLRPRGSNGTVAVRLIVVVWPVRSMHRAAVLVLLAGTNKHFLIPDYKNQGRGGGFRATRKPPWIRYWQYAKGIMYHQ